MKKIMLGIITALSLAGCSTVISNVSSFSTLPVPLSGQTIHLVAYPEERKNTLEWKSYQTKFANAFLIAGFTLAPFESADYVAFISYGIGDGKTIKSLVSTPVYGQTGGGTTYHSGSVSTSGSYGTYSGTSHTVPTYGIVGMSTNTVTRTIYTRNIAIDIAERASLNTAQPVKVYEGRLTSTGSCSQIPEVIDELIEAMFRKFPDGAGKVSVSA